MYPASTLMAAAVLLQNSRRITGEWFDGNADRLEVLKAERSSWPSVPIACAAAAPVLGKENLTQRLLWATRELGLMLIQADPDMPQAVEIPVAYWGIAHGSLRGAALRGAGAPGVSMQGPSPLTP
eukprot:gene17864-biopygen6006